MWKTQFTHTKFQYEQQMAHETTALKPLQVTENVKFNAGLLKNILLKTTVIFSNKISTFVQI